MSTCSISKHRKFLDHLAVNVVKSIIDRTVSRQIRKQYNRVEQIGFADSIWADKNLEWTEIQSKMMKGFEAIDFDSRDHRSPQCNLYSRIPTCGYPEITV